MKDKITKSIIIATFFNLVNYAQTGINYTPNGSETAELIIKRKNSLQELRINTGQTGMIPNQVISTDDYGNATWKTVNLDNKLAITGTYGTGFNKEYYGNSYSHLISDYTGTSITLPPGKWAVNINFNANIKIISRPNNTSAFTESGILNTHNFWLRLILSDNTTTNSNYNNGSTSDRLLSNLYLASGLLKGPATSTLIKGEIFINNTSSGNKTYYLKISVEKNSNVIYNNNNGYKITGFARGPSYEENGADRLYALPMGI